MSEELEAGLNTALSGVSALGPWGAVLGVAGFALGHRARKKREKAEKLARKQKADSMLSQAYERGRITRKKAGEGVAKYEGAGLSRDSGTAAAYGGGVVREGIYQSSAMLAGLPKDHKMRNPAMFGMA